MPKITINYNYPTDTTTIKVAPEFVELPLIHQADALKDALYDLEKIYALTVARTFRLMPRLEIAKKQVDLKEATQRMSKEECLNCLTNFLLWHTDNDYKCLPTADQLAAAITEAVKLIKEVK